MAAVALYALPDATHGPFTNMLRERFQWVVRPYILMTSQWQQWNLFSPEPLRRVVTYGIDVDRGDRWERVLTIEPGTYSTFRHATQFKFFARILEGASESSFPMIANFLEQQCRELALATGSHVRLNYMMYVIPLPPRALSVGEWERTAPVVTTYPGSEILCGWPHSAGVFRPFNP